MEKQNVVGAQAPGADAPELSLEFVKKNLKMDLGCAISCLNAIRSDPDMFDALAQFMYGRFTNDLNRKANGHLPGE